MLIRIFLLLFMVFAHYRSQEAFHNLEPLDFRQMNGTQENDTATHETESSLVRMYTIDGGNLLHFRLDFMGRMYQIVLVKSALPTYTSANSEVCIFDANKTLIYNTSELNLSFYTGRVINSPGSMVQGTVANGVFVGSIETEPKTLYIERYDRYFNDSKYNAFIYEPEHPSLHYCQGTDCDIFVSKSRNVRQSSPTNKTYKVVILNQNAEKEPLIQLQEPREPRTNDKTPQYGYGKVCEILAVSDHTYFEFHMKTLSNVMAEMTLVVTAVSKEFERVDFDGDGRPDKITLHYATTEVYQRPTGHHGSKLDDDLSQEELLLAFSRLQWRNRFCLAVLFTARDFHPKAGPGLAFTAVSNSRGPDGGICSPVANYGSPISGRARLNTLLVSSVHNGKGVPFSTMVTNLLHQVGHSFGSYHDPLSELSCHPENELGDFIMNSELYQEEMPHKRTFSTCSIFRMLPVIRNKGWCLMDKTSVPSERWQDKCGNGIVEDEEECDCGVETSCVSLDPCCGPTGGMSPCRLIPGAICSPSIDACCSAHCSYRERGESCAASTDHECSSYGVCTGGKGCIHALPTVKDTEKCSNDQGTCNNGICESTVCTDNQLKMCKCDFPAEHRCHVCCEDQTSGNCTSAFNLGIKGPNDEPFKQPLGWPCYNEMGTCNRKGMCEMVVKKAVTDRVLFGYQRLRIENASSGWIVNHLVLLIFAVLLILFLLLCLCGLIMLIAPSKELRQFRAACMESKKRIKEGGEDWDELVGRSRLNNWSKDRIIRLYAMFPHASASQIIRASQESEEQGSVQFLLAEGIPIRNNFQVPWPPESLVGPHRATF